MADKTLSKAAASLLGSLLIAVAIVIAGYLARPVTAGGYANDIITIQQSVRRDMKADYAQFKFSFVNLGRNMAELDRKTAEGRATVKKFAADNGISESGVQFTLSVTDLAAQSGQESIADGPSLRVEQSVTIASAEVDKVTALAAKVGELGMAGLYLLPSDQGYAGPTYQLLNYEGVKPDLLDDALKASRRQADQIAAALGKTVASYSSVDSVAYSVFDSGQSVPSTYDTAAVKNVQADASISFRIR